jgi:AcrR family transcriptional regulator
MDAIRHRRQNPARTELRRQQVLTAAEACFCEDGFRGASMADISRRAGMSTGHIYHYFRSKEAIVEAIVERDEESGLQLIERLKGSDNILETMIERVDDCMVDRPDITKAALLLEIKAEASRNPVMAEIVRDCHNRIREQIEDILKAGQAQGSVSREIDVTAIAVFLITLWDGITVRLAIDEDVDRNAMVATIRQAYDRMLRPGKA